MLPGRSLWETVHTADVQIEGCSLQVTGVRSQVQAGRANDVGPMLDKSQILSHRVNEAGVATAGPDQLRLHEIAKIHGGAVGLTFELTSRNDGSA